MEKRQGNNVNGRLVTVQTVAYEYNLDTRRVTATAKEAGAFIKIGKSARIDIKKFNDYIGVENSELENGNGYSDLINTVNSLTNTVNALKETVDLMYCKQSGLM